MAIFSCRQPESNCVSTEAIIHRIDSLENRLHTVETAVKPRLSVLMNRLHIHHFRMWEPGTNGNWGLLSYELKETRESLDDIRLLYGEIPHGNSLLGPELDKLNVTFDSLRTAVDSKSKDDFVKSYNALTLKCNNCHKEAGLDFYEIIKPSKPAYSGEIQ